MWSPEEKLHQMLREQLDELVQHAFKCPIPEGCEVCERAQLVREFLLYNFQTIDYPRWAIRNRCPDSQKPLTRKKPSGTV